MTPHRRRATKAQSSESAAYDELAERRSRKQRRQRARDDDELVAQPELHKPAPWSAAFWPRDDWRRPDDDTRPSA